MQRDDDPQGASGDGLTILGTLDSVKRQITNTLDVMPMSPILVCQYHQQLSQGQTSRTIDDFSEQVLPECRVLWGTDRRRFVVADYVKDSSKSRRSGIE